jgi:hypothetical protein
MNLFIPPVPNDLAESDIGGLPWFLLKKKEITNREQ